MPKLDKLIDLEQLQIVSKNKQKQIDDLKEKKVNREEGKGLSSNDFTDSYKTQVETNTANRHTHSNKELLDTYTQTEANIADAVSKKHSHSNKSVLDAITASYTTEEKTKLSGIESGAEVNVQSDWEESDDSKDEFIKNKPEFERVDDRLIPILPYIDPDKEYDFIDHINEPTYRFTAPLNSKLLMLQSIAGNSNKIAPSTPSDDSVVRLKVIPDNTYKSQIDYIGGKSVKYNQLFNPSIYSATNTINGITFTKNNNGSYTVSGTLTDTSAVYNFIVSGGATPIINGHKQLLGIIGNKNNNLVVHSNTFYGDTQTNSYRIIEGTSSVSGNTWWNLRFTGQVGDTINETVTPIFIDLTDKFGAGNEPSTVETAIPLLKANGYKLDGTDTYSTGSLKHAITTSVVYSGNLVDWTKNNVGSGTLEYGRISLNAGTYTIQLFVDKGDTTACTLYIDGTSIGTINVGSSLTFTITTLNNALFSGYVNGAIGSNNIKFALYKGSTAPSTYIPYVAPITKAIPSEVLALELYKSAGSVYDVIDCNNKTGTRKIQTYTFTGNETWYIENGYAYSGILNPNGKLNTPVTITNSIITSAKVNQTYKNTLLIYLDTTVYNTSAKINDITRGNLIEYELDEYVPYDLAQYFTDGWNKVDLDNLYATCEMVVAEPIDMPNKVEYYGTIIHSLATAVKQEGFNKWDGTIEYGVKYENNELINLYADAKTSLDLVIHVLDSNGSYIRNISKTITTSGNRTNVVFYSGNILEGQWIRFKHNGSTQDIPFIKFANVIPNISYCLSYELISNHPDVVGGLVFKQPCINISNQDLNGTYKPYKAPITRLLPNSEEKYSWGITDGVRNTRVFCDDEGNAVNEGSLVVDNQDLGSLVYFIQNDFFFSEEFNIKTVSSDNDTPNVLISTYTTVNYSYLVYSGNDKVVSMYSNLPRIAIRNSAYSTTEAFKTAMSGEPLFYEKNTTDTETLDDFDYFFDCEEGDTFTIIGCELLQCYATYSFVVEHVE